MRTILILAAMMIAGCASEPRTPTAAKAAPATAAAPAAAVAPATQSQVAQAEPGAYKPPPGYRAKKLGSTTVYCKKDTILGSRFPTETCVTQDELKDLLRREEEQRRNVQQGNGICSGGAICGTH